MLATVASYNLHVDHTGIFSIVLIYRFHFNNYTDTIGLIPMRCRTHFSLFHLLLVTLGSEEVTRALKLNLKLNYYPECRELAWSLLDRVAMKLAVLFGVLFLQLAVWRCEGQGRPKYIMWSNAKSAKLSIGPRVRQ